MSKFEIIARNPVGGGVNYRDGVKANQAKVIVRSKRELRIELSKASSGDIIYIGPKMSFDITGEGSIKIPTGVTLASGRGINGEGALLYTTDYAHNPIIEFLGPQARLTGVRIQGPDPETRTGAYVLPNSIGIRVPYGGIEIDNCEISAWSHAGIMVYNGGTVFIHNNHIHHCRRSGLGYGICLASGKAYATIYSNVLEYNRHDVAANGTPGNFYDVGYNWILGNGTQYSIDMHGGRQRKDGTDIAGEGFEIHHNLFYSYPYDAITICGRPLKTGLIYNNVYAHVRAGARVFGEGGNINIYDDSFINYSYMYNMKEITHPVYIDGELATNRIY